jgi:hypothetical protein
MWPAVAPEQGQRATVVRAAVVRAAVVRAVASALEPHRGPQARGAGLACHRAGAPLLRADQTRRYQVRAVEERHFLAGAVEVLLLAAVAVEGLGRAAPDVLAMYVLVERGGQWWLAAGQNTPVAESPTSLRP